MILSKKQIFIAAGAIIALSSCSENAWNDHLDGFETPGIADGKVTVDYTLTPADYKTISSNSDNKALAAEKGLDAQLAAIGANGCFATEEEAQLFIPALLSSASAGLPYYTYNDGSSVNIGYEVSSALPKDVIDFNSKQTLTFQPSEADWQQVWGSNTDFIEAFTPAKSPAANLPRLLAKSLQAENGQYAVATYNYTTTEPDFGHEEPSFEMTDVITKTAEGNEITVRGYVTAIDARGFVVSDKSGSILCYQASGFDQSALELGNQIEVNGTVSSFNKGFQISVTPDNYQVLGSGKYTYPTPKEVTGPDMDQAITATDNFYAQYVSFVGKVSVSGNYYNIDVDGAETSRGSLYQTPDYIKAQLTDGETYRFTGYFASISGGKYYNLVCVSVQAPAAKVRRAAAGGIQLMGSLYQYNGSAWAAASGMELIQPYVYKEVMGLSYANFSGSQPDQYIPTYLRETYPYAQDGDKKTVVYLYHTSDGDSYQARQYEFADGQWTRTVGKGSLQFTRMEGVWKFNPSVEITLPAVRNTPPTYTYYMACVNWVLDNIVKPTNPDATLTTATPLIDYRGNAEFYSGASAYYGNVDVRAATALAHCPDGFYDGLSDDEITMLVKKRFCLESMRGALKQLHGDMRPVEGMDVTVTIHFTSYAPATTEETLVYTVTAPGEFTYKSCTWFTNGEDKDWK